MNYNQNSARVREYKQQKYKLLVAKQDLAVSDIEYFKKKKLNETIDESLKLVDAAIMAATRIADYQKAIESEIKGYQIIESKLEELILDSNFDGASTRMTTNKLNRVGEHLLHLEQLVKYKS